MEHPAGLLTYAAAGPQAAITHAHRSQGRAPTRARSDGRSGILAATRGQIDSLPTWVAAHSTDGRRSLIRMRSVVQVHLAALITCASEEGLPRGGEAGRGGREPCQPGMPAFRYLVVPRRLPAREQAATTARSGTARSPCTRRPGRSARCGVSASGRRRRSPGRWPPCPATGTSTGAGQIPAARPSARR